MTIYEQIQKTLDWIEENLLNQQSQLDVASMADMSARSFQKYFWMVTGCSYKEYLVKRRLSIALQYIASTDITILMIALEIGYRSHESFTRAFKREFGVSPRSFRQGGYALTGLARITLFKELYMGVIIKELPDLLVVCFEGFGPEPENKAKAKLAKWMREHPTEKPRRIFGHNIDREGKVDCNPQNVGYRFSVTIEKEEKLSIGNRVKTLPAGKYVVTGIEGNFTTDPAGNWIREGWKRLNLMVAAKDYKVTSPARWFEEELEPREPGNLRLDLYLEIDQRIPPSVPN